jgi:hypothetical protein
MSLRVGFDLDGVIADFRTAFEAASRNAAPSSPSGDADAPIGLTEAEIRRAWKGVSAAHNWWTTVRPYEPAQIARLYAIARRHRWEVFFLTKRPATVGDSVQVQSQWWLEQHGYYMPAVLTVPGSRGEIANALRLDLVIDDQQLNCVEVISASSAKAILMVRDPALRQLRDHAISRGIGVVSSMEESLNVLEGVQEMLPQRRGRLMRLADWFPGAKRDGEPLPLNPRATRPLPPDPAD